MKVLYTENGGQFKTQIMDLEFLQKIKLKGYSNNEILFLNEDSKPLNY